jgi:hypothetical protein
MVVDCAIAKEFISSSIDNENSRLRLITGTKIADK